MSNVVVLDLGFGNLHAAVRALEKVGASVEISANMDTVMAADGLVVTGVGAFESVMSKVRETRADRMIERRLAGGRPVLGISAGMQLMFEASSENGHHEGLAQWDGTAEMLQGDRVPHVGWSRVTAAKGTQLLSGLDGERFYFAHSYGVLTDPSEGMEDSLGHFEPPKVSFGQHGDTRFVAAVENGALSATQFHPQKSADAGLQLLKNWLGTL